MSEPKRAQGTPPGTFRTRDPQSAFRFDIPTLPMGYVDRPRLLSVLDQGAARMLTLVSAPAGTGKTSLVADWVGRRDPELTAWITFEPGDGHAPAFWSSAFQQLHSRRVAAAGTQLAPTGPDVPRTLLAEVAAELSAREHGLTLVLDGWEFTTDDVADGFDFLLRHSRGGLRAVILTRADPVLPLNRYRLNDLMTEVRTADLAFTPGEVRALVDASGLALTEQSVDNLTTRTGGWAAGLRFAMMYLLRQPDPDVAVLRLAGDTGNIAEYLMAEVLEMQSDADRELLLNTSIVEILRPGLIEELGGRTATRGLAQLARGNAFVETVADHPGWYRYHPLFRDLLRAELDYLAPDRAIALHRRAGRWFAAHKMLGAAVWHASAAFQWAEAARYVVDDLALGMVVQGRDQDSLLRTLRSLPADVRGAAPAIVRAAVAMARGDTTLAQQELERAQSEGETSSSAGGRTGERSQRLANSLIASLVTWNDPDATVALQISTASERALRGQAPDRLAAHPELVAMIIAARATALVRMGRLREGREDFTAAVAVSEAPGCEPTLVYCLSHLAVLDAVDGALRQASNRAERALGLVTSAGVDGCGLQAASCVALAWVALQQGDAATARKRIADVPTDGLDAVLPASLLRLAAARLAGIDGDIGRAMDIAQEVRQKVATSVPWVADLSVEEEVASALSDVDGSVADHLVAALSERKDTGAQLTSARLQLRKRVTGAADSLGPVAARATEPLVAQVTAGLLVAEGALQRGESARARSSVERASRLAAPEGLKWPFHVASSAVRELVPRVHPPTAGRSSPGAGHLIKHSRQHSAPDGRRRDTAPADDAQAPLIDQLTAKELEVLRHLSELLTTEEIATAMFVSVNTVRTHVRSILRKLSVSRRHQAVRRARALDILTAS